MTTAAPPQPRVSMVLAPVAAEVRSTRWSSDSVPAVSVVVATRDRAPFLPELFAALCAQEHADAEVIVVDDGSADDTWAVLTELAARTSLRLFAVRLAASAGPSVARNTAAARARARWLAFTDDDCLPMPGWLAGLTQALAGGVAIVQGRTEPVPDVPHGPWDRTIVISAPTPLYETCNLGVPRSEFLRCGGFSPLDLLPPAHGRGFGEDAVFGARLLVTGARRDFAADAVVQHRWLPGRYADHLAGLRRLTAFPALGQAVPEVAAAYWHTVFLSRRTAAFDAALLGTATALLARRAPPALLALPWLRAAWPAARDKPGRPVPVRLAQLALADAVGLAALLRGSIRARCLLL